MPRSLRICFLSLLIVFAFSSVAFAEGEAPATEPAAAPAAAPEPPPAPESDESRWDGFTLAPRIGWMYLMDNVGKASTSIGGISVPAASTKRHAMKVTLGLEFGGDGAGYDLQFIYGYETPDFGYNTWHSIGLYNGFSYRLHFGDWYPYFGLGVSLGWILTGGDYDIALESIARIPLGVTYYVLEDLGIIMEFGIGYQISALGDTDGSLNSGHGLYMDASVGIRWP